MFELEEFVFECGAARGTETADFAVAADYTVAGDNQRQWITGHHDPDGPGGKRAACLLC